MCYFSPFGTNSPCLKEFLVCCPVTFYIFWLVYSLWCGCVSSSSEVRRWCLGVFVIRAFFFLLNKFFFSVSGVAFILFWICSILIFSPFCHVCSLGGHFKVCHWRELQYLQLHHRLSHLTREANCWFEFVSVLLKMFGIHICLRSFVQEYRNVFFSLQSYY